MAALCTFVVMDNLFCCVWRLDPAECAQLGWSSSSGVPGSGSSSVPLHLKSSSQVPLTFRSFHYYSTTTTRDHVFHVSSFLLVCWTDLLLVPSDVLLQMYCLRKYCRYAHLPSSRANWSYYAMYFEDAIRFRITHGLVTLLQCALCWTVWTLHSLSVSILGVGAPYPWILQGMTWECHRLGKGVVTKLYGFLP